VDADMSLTDSDTKRLLVHTIENMDDLISHRHLTYDDYEDDFDLDKLEYRIGDNHNYYSLANDISIHVNDANDNESGMNTSNGMIPSQRW